MAIPAITAITQAVSSLVLGAATLAPPATPPLNTRAGTTCSAVTKVLPATSTAWSAVQADGTDKPAKRHPALESLPLGFSSSDIVEIDTARLRDGFIILNDASGHPLYELPIRLQPEMVAETYVTSKYIFVVYNVKYSYAEDAHV